MTGDEIKPVKLAYTLCDPDEDSGSNACPIILLHGLFSSKERWENIQQVLANKSKRKVYAVDARNHGESEKSVYFTFNILKDDLENFMDLKHIPRAILIGHSMGGMVAMLLAQDSPERVEKLVIVDTFPKDFPPEFYGMLRELTEEKIRCFEESVSSDTEATMFRKLRECLYRTVPMIPDTDHALIENMSFPIKKMENGFAPLTNLEVILKALMKPPIVFFTDKVFSGYALFIYGDHMPVYEQKEVATQLFPKATFSCFQNTGHEVINADPEKFMQEVLDFL